VCSMCCFSFLFRFLALFAESRLFGVEARAASGICVSSVMGVVVFAFVDVCVSVWDGVVAAVAVACVAAVAYMVEGGCGCFGAMDVDDIVASRVIDCANRHVMFLRKRELSMFMPSSSGDLQPDDDQHKGLC
jgi:hypothetical protein